MPFRTGIRGGRKPAPFFLNIDTVDRVSLVAKVWLCEAVRSGCVMYGHAMLGVVRRGNVMRCMGRLGCVRWCTVT